MRRLQAFAVLAWALLRTLLAPLFGRRRGLAAFERSYAEDRLAAVDFEQRRTLSTLSGCIACGRCDEGEGGRMAASRGSYAGVMDLMLASSRNMPDFDAAALSFRQIDDEVLERLERVCPTRVPMREVKRFVLAMAREFHEPLK